MSIEEFINILCQTDSTGGLKLKCDATSNDLSDILTTSDPVFGRRVKVDVSGITSAIESPFNPIDSPISVGDTYQQAFEKAQGQIDGIAANYVPYIGATTNVNLGTHSIIMSSGTTDTEMSPSYFGVEISGGAKYGLLEYDKLTISDSTIPKSIIVSATDITLSDTGSNNVSILAPTTITSSYDLKLPIAQGNANTYLKNDGSGNTSWETVSGGGGGGGGGVSYYLNGGTNQGTFVGDTYYEMSKTAVIALGVNFTIATNGYIANFITDAGDPALLNIPAGNWNFEMYFNVSSSGGSPSFYVELYKYNGATFTLIASSSTAPEIISGGTTIDLYITALAVPQTTLTLTDRLAVRIHVNNSGRTVTLHTQDNTLCQVITTFSTGLSALNGLTEQVQTFATGTTGTDFNISSVISTHTFNLPIASTTNTGKLSNTDYANFKAAVNSANLFNYYNFY